MPLLFSHGFMVLKSVQFIYMDRYLANDSRNDIVVCPKQIKDVAMDKENIIGNEI